MSRTTQVSQLDRAPLPTVQVVMPSATTARARGGAVNSRTRIESSFLRRRAALARPVRVCAGGDLTPGTNLDPKWAVMPARRLRAELTMEANGE